jgi:hypothetical protein
LREALEARNQGASSMFAVWNIFVLEQCVSIRAKGAGFWLSLEVRAHQTTSGPSKSTDRKTPYCLIRSSWGSVSR